MEQPLEKPNPVARRSRLLAAARGTCLAVAFGLGVIVPVDAALRPAPALLGWRVGPVERLEPALAPLRPHLPPAARVGYLVSRDPKARDATNDDVGRFCAAQYALAPALVRSIVVPECEAHGAAACGLTAVQYLVARGAAPPALVPMAQQLGLFPVAQAGGFVLLGPEPR